MNSLPSIPWLVQIAKAGDTHASPGWQTVTAQTSQGAVVAWLESHEHVLPIRLRVGPAAAILRHPNGMPMMSREFTVTAEMPADHVRLLDGVTP